MRSSDPIRAPGRPSPAHDQDSRPLDRRAGQLQMISARLEREIDDLANARTRWTMAMSRRSQEFSGSDDVEPCGVRKRDGISAANRRPEGEHTSSGCWPGRALGGSYPAHGSGRPELDVCGLAQPQRGRSPDRAARRRAARGPGCKGLRRRRSVRTGRRRSSRLGQARGRYGRRGQKDDQEASRRNDACGSYEAGQHRATLAA